MKVTTTKLENQGLAKKTLYWLQIEEGEKKVTISVGEKTFNAVNDLKIKEDKK